MAGGSSYESIRVWEKRCLVVLEPISLYLQLAQPLDMQYVHELEELKQVSNCVFRGGGGVVDSSSKLYPCINSDYSSHTESSQHA